MAKLIMDDIFKKHVRVLSKFMWKNQIVLYDVQLSTGHHGYIRRDVFDSILQKYGIDLQDRSDILRVNVDETDAGFFVKKDTNSEEVRQYYSQSSLYIQDSGMEFARYLDHLMSESLRTEESVSTLRNWLRKESFIKITDARDDSFCAYLCISE